MKNEFITIENESKIYQVRKNEILAITVDSKIVSYTLENREPICKTMTLKQALEQLPKLIQINRRCAINCDKVKEIYKKTRNIILENDGGSWLSVGGAYAGLLLACAATGPLAPVAGLVAIGCIVISSMEHEGAILP